MPREEILDQIEKYVDPFRIKKGKGFRLKDFDPGDTRGLKLDKGEATELLATRHQVARGGAGHALRPGSLVVAARVPGDGRGRQGRHDQARHVGRQSAGLPGLLVQAAVGGGARPRLPVALRQGLPERGRIGIFNRSYYEEVLVVRVHPEILKRRSCRRARRQEDLGRAVRRHRALRALPHAAGHVILKFFLHVSRKEQKKRFLERLDEPEKNWKFSAADVTRAQVLERLHARVRGSDPGNGTKHAPWFVVPADNKWFTRLVVAAAIVEAWRNSTSPTRRSTRRRRRSCGRACGPEPREVVVQPESRFFRFQKGARVRSSARGSCAAAARTYHR